MPPQPEPTRTAQSLAGPVATLRFLPEWEEVLEGEIVQGGALRIEYTAERTLQAFSGPDGLTPPNVEAHLRFEPGGQHLLGSVSTAFELPVPDDAERLVLFFQATDRDRTTAWDSKYGENYQFRIVPGPGATASASPGTSRGTSRPSARSQPDSSPAPGSARSSAGGTPRPSRTA
jgi:hypothetical protein